MSTYVKIMPGGQFKTMCIAFNCKDKSTLSSITLNVDPLPLIDKVNHLGYTLSSDCRSAKDVLEKRAAFISTTYNLNQEFNFANHETRLKMCRLYNTAFYGSNCWDFSSDQVNMFSKTWNVNLRILYDIPRETHCWIVEELSEGRHFLQMVYSRFAKYIMMIKNNKRPFLGCLYDIIKDDVKTATGSNIRTLLLSTAVDPRFMSRHLLKDWRVHPPEDNWTVPLLISLLVLRAGNWEVLFDDEEEALNNDEVDFMIEAVSTG